MIHQENLKVQDMHVYYSRASNCMNQLLPELKRDREMNNYSGDFNVPFSVIYRTSRQETSKNTGEVKNTTNQLDLIDIYRHFTQTHLKY